MRQNKKGLLTRHNIGTRLWWSGLLTALVILVALALGSGASSLANANPQSKDPRIPALTKGTIFLADIPETLPANGVSVEDGHIVLRPLSAAQKELVHISRQQALELAHGQFQETASFSITIMLLASFTNVDTVPIDTPSVPAVVIKDVPAWVVVYTSASPMSPPAHGAASAHNTPMPPPPPTYYRFNIALNAQTGAYLCGFYTP